MSWNGKICIIEWCKEGVGLQVGNVLTFPVEGAVIEVTKDQEQVQVAWTIGSYQSDDLAWVTHGGQDYRIHRLEEGYTCAPAGAERAGKAGPRLRAVLAGGVLGVVAGAVSAGLLGLSLPATVAVAVGAALVALAIALPLNPSPGGEAGTTWTARDGNALVEQPAPSVG